MYLPVVCIEHPELEVVDDSNFVAFRQMAELLHEDSTNSIEIVLAQTCIEVLVELLYGGERFDDVVGVTHALDEVVTDFLINFIFNVTDDFFQDIFNR